MIDWLGDMAHRHKRRLMVRLVKGAYWDSEIKNSQERGLPGYPVFTRKATTDVSYIACAKKLLADGEAFFPQFATHNAHSLSAVIEMAGGEAEARDKLEFQRLHGMGEPLYEQVVPAETMGIAARIYAPVGSHEDLLAYLVRRLLENGANTSFVNRIVDEKAPLDEIVADPVAKVRKLARKPHPRHRAAFRHLRRRAPQFARHRPHRSRRPGAAEGRDRICRGASLEDRADHRRLSNRRGG